MKMQGTSNEDTQAGVATVINLANWTGADLTSLTPHEPEPKKVVVIFEIKH
jgi:hypothetical protein